MGTARVSPPHRPRVYGRPARDSDAWRDADRCRESVSWHLLLEHRDHRPPALRLGSLYGDLDVVGGGGGGGLVFEVEAGELGHGSLEHLVAARVDVEDALRDLFSHERDGKGEENDDAG